MIYAHTIKSRALKRLRARSILERVAMGFQVEEGNFEGEEFIGRC